MVLIAVSGVGIAFFARPASVWRIALLLSVLIFTSFSTTDFFPPYLRAHFMQPLKIKVFPCLVACSFVFFDLMLLKKKPGNNSIGKILTVN